ncbi:hypothetical protein ABZT48_09620 [Streptomyces avermitilis]|uniref:hypothetical protein n=1 Tax=Streptomyces avermitilis TaxID=33903 RepID=UPI0033B20574
MVVPGGVSAGPVLTDLADAGLQVRALLAVEGPAELLANLGELLQDEVRCEEVMGVPQQMEAQPSVLGTSAHVPVVAQVVTC